MRICRGCCGHLGQRWKKNRRATRGRIMGVRPTQSREGVKGGLRPFSSAPCRVKGQRPLWGLGQRPNCSASDQFQGSRQQRCRQRSVPAPNFARPQTRPQVALPPRFREEPIKTPYRARKCPVWGFNCHDIISASPQILPATARQSSGTCTSDAQHRGTPGHCPAAADPASLGRARSTSACAD